TLQEKLQKLQQSYDALYASYDITQKALAEARSLLHVDTEKMHETNIMLRQQVCQLQEDLEGAQQWKDNNTRLEARIETLNATNERLERSRNEWREMFQKQQEESSKLRRAKWELESQCANLKLQIELRNAVPLQILRPSADDQLLRKLLALAHPDKWSQGQPATDLAHELTVAINHLRQ